MDVRWEYLKVGGGSGSTCFGFMTLLGSILHLEMLSRGILSWRSKESF